ncbi:MAG: cytoplasmic protein [Desulfobacterales bacterium]
MADSVNSDRINLNIDATKLYREESYTDLQVGAVRRLVPVTVSGGADSSRTEIYIGSTQLMTPGGPLPVQTRLMANSFEEALAVFPQAMAAAIEEMMREIEKMAAEQQQEDSRIIVPGRSQPGPLDPR